MKRIINDILDFPFQRYDKYFLKILKDLFFVEMRERHRLLRFFVVIVGVRQQLVENLWDGSINQNKREMENNRTHVLDFVL